MEVFLHSQRRTQNSSSGGSRGAARKILHDAFHTLANAGNALLETMFQRY